ncbi:2Fe-2S iron-sulfur cluster-binding protein, partial [Thermaurantiacus sp.]
MIRLSLMGHEIEVAKGTDLLTACLGHGVEVPHFCWHEALGSVGACRLCAVHVSHPDGTSGLSMACMTEAAPGLAVDPWHQEAIRFRAQVIEWLLAAHPHDCAVCEAGGACHLQDMAALSGHHRRRVRDPKRHHAQQDLGPFLTHEMNRCIACYRCTRFYRDFAGGRDFAAFGSQARVWFGRARPGPLESPFAGNLAELCPTGVFNDRAWSESYARPWDMERTPALCTRCAVGCNMTLHAREGRLRKAEARFHAALNRHFLCDRGRFGVHAVHGSQRAGEGASLAEARRLLARGAIGLGSPHASLEANLALRDFVGQTRFFSSASDARLALDRRMLSHLATGGARRADLADMASADAVLLMACDLVAEAPLAALMLRQASRAIERARASAKGVPPFLDEAVRIAGEGARAPFILLSPEASALDAVATHLHRLPPSAMLELARAILAALEGEAGAAGQGFTVAARGTAELLSAARAPLILTTAGAGDPALADAAAAIARKLAPGAALAFLPLEANAFGLPLLEPRGGLQSALHLARESGLPLVALEPGEAAALLEPVGEALVRLDWLAGGPGRLLSIAAPEESAGLFVNFEGRMQETHAALPASAPWAPAVLADLAGTPAPSLADMRERLRAACPFLAPGLPQHHPQHHPQ